MTRAAAGLRERLARETLGLELPGWFFDDALARDLRERSVLEVRRTIDAGVALAWTTLIDAAAVPGWVSAARVRVLGPGPLRPGVRIAARGHVADRRASLDTTIVTDARDDVRLAWATRSRLPPLWGAIEFRWAIDLQARDGRCEALHRLRGVAFPPGPAGVLLRRAYRRISDGMDASMHRGLERFAALVEARAR